MSEERASEEGPGDGGDAGRTPDISVCIVDAQTPGNVGTIARAMKNFGVEDLLLVDPPEIEPDGEAYGFAGHARQDVLPGAEEITFDELCANYHTVGFTAITGEDSRKHVRFPYSTPEDLVEELRGVDSPVALVFGREDKGLSNEELGRLDQVASIPADPEYPVMNLGQAATVTLYELRKLTLEQSGSQLPDTEPHRADPEEVERLHDYWDEFLTAMGHREHKHEKTQRMFRRLVGRANATDREVTTLLGVLRRATDQLEERQELLDELDEEDELRR
ncbi:RNA methyltransferase [Halolamina sp. CBA1230]|uniref:RNA methyltransferase n=1 Tax=Halolamina sp. CBA1230 TaxID=1853690 RepID=UPI0009A2140F|nr:RNA methyltransferase [Halolamina sp. CBA1230]QKY21569.1 RNA methyltransferase [Halolamina sp. CBA1230]